MNSEVCHAIQKTSFPLSQEDLRKQLKHQLEFYFSAENLSNDSYMLSQMDSDNYISISTIANFNKVKNLTNDLQLVVDILRESPYVQVEPAGLKVRPAQKQRSIVILREISQDTPVEEVEELFNGENCPQYLSCEFGLNNSWYIFFESEDDAQKAYKYLREEKSTFQGKPIMARIKAKQILHSTNQHTTSTASKPSGTTTTLPSTQQTSVDSSKVSQSNAPRTNEEQLLNQPSYPNISYITHFQPATIIHNNGGIPVWQGVNSPLISLDPSMIRFTTLYDFNKNSQSAQLSQTSNEHILHPNMQHQLQMFPNQQQTNQQQILYQKQPFQQGRQLHNVYTQPQHPHIMHNLHNQFVQQQPRQKLFFNHANKVTQSTSNNNNAAVSNVNKPPIMNNKINNLPMGNLEGFKLVEPFSHHSFQNLPQFQHQQTFINPQHTQLQNNVHQQQQGQNHLKPQHLTIATTSNINDTKDNATKFKKTDLNRQDQIAKRPQNFYPPNQMFNNSNKSSNSNNFSFTPYNNFNYNNRNYNINRNNVNMIKKPLFPKSSNFSQANINKPLIQNEPSTSTSKNPPSTLKCTQAASTSHTSSTTHVASPGSQTPTTCNNTAVTSSTTSISTTIEKSEQVEQVVAQNEVDTDCQAENAKSKLNDSNCTEEKDIKIQNETKVYEGTNGNNSSVIKNKKARANIKSYQNKNNISVRNESEKGYAKATTSTQQSSSHTSTSPALSFQFRKHNNASVLNNNNNNNHDNNNIGTSNNTTSNNNNNNSNNTNNNNNNNNNNNSSNNKSSFKAPYNNDKYKDCSNYAIKKNTPARPRRGMNSYRGFRGSNRGGRTTREDANQRNFQVNKTATKEKPALPAETFDKSFPPLNKVPNGHKNDMPDQTESFHFTIANSSEGIDLKDINNNNLRLSYAQIIQRTGVLHGGSTEEALVPNIHSLSLVNPPLAS